MLVLALNVGSSSLKCAVFDISADPAHRIVAATVTMRAGRLAAVIVSADGATVSEESAESADVNGSVAWLLARLEREGLAAHLIAVGHRLAHGGAHYRDPIWLTPDVMTDLRQLVPPAPDHLPAELGAIDGVATRWPRVRQAACFDTAAHRDLPNRARLFGLPRQITEAGVVRFGFHGLSYEYVVGELRASGALGQRTVVAFPSAAVAVAAAPLLSAVDGHDTDGHERGAR